MELKLLTDSHFKLICLDDTQELFYTSCPKLAFDYDEVTKSLVKELTLTMAEILSSDNSDISARNATITSEVHCYEIETSEH
jgi:hypothetical protein